MPISSTAIHNKNRTRDRGGDNVLSDISITLMPTCSPQADKICFGSSPNGSIATIILSVGILPASFNTFGICCTAAKRIGKSVWLMLCKRIRYPNYDAFRRVDVHVFYQFAAISPPFISHETCAVDSPTVSLPRVSYKLTDTISYAWVDRSMSCHAARAV